MLYLFHRFHFYVFLFRFGFTSFKLLCMQTFAIGESFVQILFF